MPDTTYFTQNEDAPLAIPDNRGEEFTGFISSRKYPVAEGQGSPRPDQRLANSTASGLSELTHNTVGSETYVSWLTRQSLKEYGVTKLPPKD